MTHGTYRITHNNDELYRLFGTRLLYVGKGQDGAQDGLADHRTKPWGRYINSFEWTPAVNAWAAYRREYSMIRGDGPIANKQHNWRNGRNTGYELERLIKQGVSVPAAKPADPHWLVHYIGPVAATGLAVGAVILAL